jgi:hypothetical protein
MAPTGYEQLGVCQLQRPQPSAIDPVTPDNIQIKAKLQLQSGRFERVDTGLSSR